MSTNSQPRRHPGRGRRVSAAACVGVLAVAALAACSSSRAAAHDTPATPSSSSASQAAQNVPLGKAGTPRGGEVAPKSVDSRSPDAVATTVIATAYRYDTRLDASPMDALRRARPWLSTAYAATVLTPAPAGGGADWLNLAQHDGWTTTSVTPGHDDGAPPDTPSHAVRERVVTTTAHGSGGWRRPPLTVTAFIGLSRNSPASPWRVDGITVH